MKTPWKKDTTPKYAKQEARTAKKPGARAQLNSGRTWSGLRDVRRKVRSFSFLIDNKTTDDKGYRITEDDWLKFARDARRTPPGCHPMLQLDIRSVRLVVLEEDTLDAIFDEKTT